MGDYDEHEGTLGDGHPAAGEAPVHEAPRHHKEKCGLSG